MKRAYPTLLSDYHVDEDLYLSSLLVAPAYREDFLSVCIFHEELTKIPSLTSQPLLGLMRYKWWQDTLEELYHEPKNPHESLPILPSLKKAIEKHSLPKEWLLELIHSSSYELKNWDDSLLDEEVEEQAARLYKPFLTCLSYILSGQVCTSFLQKVSFLLALENKLCRPSHAPSFSLRGAPSHAPSLLLTQENFHHHLSLFREFLKDQWTGCDQEFRLLGSNRSLLKPLYVLGALKNEKLKRLTSLVDKEQATLSPFYKRWKVWTLYLKFFI